MRIAIAFAALVLTLPTSLRATPLMCFLYNGCAYGTYVGIGNTSLSPWTEAGGGGQFTTELAADAIASYLGTSTTTGNGWGRADLAAGKINLIARAFGPAADGIPYGSMVSTALWDTLTFSGSGSPFALGFSAEIRGGIENAFDQDTGEAYLYVLSSDGRVVLGSDHDRCGDAARPGEPARPCPMTLSATPTIATGTPIMIGITFSARTTRWAVADFSNTVSVDLNLPPGYSFTSASGVFLTDREASAIPEPAAVLLFASGVAALVIRKRLSNPSKGT